MYSYSAFFIFSLIIFASAIWTGMSVDGFNDISQADKYEKELRKKTIIAAIITIMSIGIAIVPIIDSYTFERVELEIPSQYGHHIDKETWYQSKFLKMKFQYSYDEPSTWYIWILVIVEGFYVLSRIGQPQKSKEEIIKHLEKKAYWVDKKREMMEKETQTIQFITNKYGKPDKIVHTDFSASYPDLNHTIFFIFDKELMYYDNRVVHFNEIISCDYVDNSRIETKQTGIATTETSTDSGSMIGRAVVGGMLAGGAGAIIGGATAKKTGNTNIQTNSVSITKHDFTIIVNTKNVRNPLLKIPCGDNEQALHEIVATLKAVVANNNM